MAKLNQPLKDNKAPGWIQWVSIIIVTAGLTIGVFGFFWFFIWTLPKYFGLPVDWSSVCFYSALIGFGIFGKAAIDMFGKQLALQKKQDLQDTRLEAIAQMVMKDNMRDRKVN